MIVERERLHSEESLEGLPADLALKLFDIGAVEFGYFRIKLHEQFPDAPLSPIYLNLRNLSDEVLDQIGKILVSIPSESVPDFCAGIPNAGVSIAKAYARHAGLPHVDIFDKKQTDTMRRIVAREEISGKGDVRIIDDTISRADTKLEAIGAAKDFGLHVSGIFVLIDREMGGREELAKEGYRLQSAMTLTQVLDCGMIAGKIDDGFRTHALIGMQGLREYLRNK